MLTSLRRNEKYLYMGGPLLAGVTVVALSSLAPMALPLGLRGLAISEAISLYGGLAVFSGFVLFEYVSGAPDMVYKTSDICPQHPEDPAQCQDGRVRQDPQGSAQGVHQP